MDHGLDAPDRHRGLTHVPTVVDVTDTTPDQRPTVPVDGGAVPTQLFLPPGGRGPGLVLCQEIFGVTEYIRGRARQLAERGHVVLVPETYWRLGSPVISEGMDGLEEAMAATGRLDWDQTVADTVAVTRALRERPEVVGPTAIMGFCFGGGLAWATTAALTRAGDPPAALVAYYGSQIPQLLDLVDDVRVPQLHHWGTADQFIPAEGVAEVERATAGSATVFVHHEGAGHAFDNPSPAFHHAQASADAWAETTAWVGAQLT